MMWGRVIEFMLACWLSISPFIFSYPKEPRFFWFNDFICSSLLALFALISYHKPLRKMHLCSLIIAFYLIALSYFFKGVSFDEPLQNYMVLGLLLFMITLVPSEANLPPIPWREFYNEDKSYTKRKK